MDPDYMPLKREAEHIVDLFLGALVQTPSPGAPARRRVPAPRGASRVRKSNRPRQTLVSR